MDVRLILRTLGRAAACAGALGAGVALGHCTDLGRPTPASASSRDSSPVVATASALTSIASESSDSPRITPFDGISPRPSDLRDPTGYALRGGRIITGNTPHRLILFTFDDGPDAHLTPILLEQLDELGVKALFFLTTGRYDPRSLAAHEQAELAREIVRRGHMVGNHTVNHDQLPLLGHDEIVAEIEESQRTIEEAIGARTWLFRPPGGAHSPRVDRLLAARGYTTVLWNLGAGDFQVRSADEVFHTFKRVLDRQAREGQHGGIVLLHDTYARTVEAFPRIVGELRQRNCRLLEQGEELYDIVDDPSFFFAPRGEADPSAEASAAVLPDAILEGRQRQLREETSLRCNALASR